MHISSATIGVKRYGKPPGFSSAPSCSKSVQPDLYKLQETSDDHEEEIGNVAPQKKGDERSGHAQTPPEASPVNFTRSVVERRCVRPVRDGDSRPDQRITRAAAVP